MESNRENLSSHQQQSSPSEHQINDPLPLVAPQTQINNPIPKYQQDVTNKIQKDKQENNEPQASEIVRPSRKHKIDEQFDLSQINIKQFKHDQVQGNPSSEVEPLVKLTKLKKSIKKGILKREDQEEEEDSYSSEIVRKKPRGRARAADKRNVNEGFRGRGRGKPRGRQPTKNINPVVEQIKKEIVSLLEPAKVPELTPSRVMANSVMPLEAQAQKVKERWISGEENCKDWQSVDAQISSQSLQRRIGCPNYYKLRQIFEKGSIQMIGQLGSTFY